MLPLTLHDATSGFLPVQTDAPKIHRATALFTLRKSAKNRSEVS